MDFKILKMQRLLVVICITLERSDHNILSSNSTEVHKFIEEGVVRKKCAKQFAKVQQNRLQSRSTSYGLSRSGQVVQKAL